MKVPLRVAFFVWTAALGKILTMENLRKRRVIILDWCCMCKSSGESVYHLFLHCPLACELRTMVLVMFGKTWVMPRDVVDLLCCWKGIRGNSEAGKIWKMVPHCLMWCLWQERNDRTFNAKERTIPALKFHFLHTLLDCSKASHLDGHVLCPTCLIFVQLVINFCCLFCFFFHPGSLPVYLYGFSRFQ